MQRTDVHVTKLPSKLHSGSLPLNENNSGWLSVGLRRIEPRGYSQTN
jgi:hypothetical protein